MSGREAGGATGTRVTFVSFPAYPLFDRRSPSGIGGAEIQMYQVARELARDESFQVSFVVGDFGQPDTVTCEGITVVKGYRPPRPRIRYLSALVGHYRFMRILGRTTPDICIQRVAGTETGLTALYCRLSGRKFIYMTASDYECDGTFIAGRGWSGRYFRYGLTHADLVITQNMFQRRMLEEKHGQGSVIWRGGYPVPENIPAAEGKKDYLLWVGRLVEVKRPELVLELAKSLPEVRLVMIAPASEDRGYSAAIAEAAGRIGNVEFIPGLPFEETGRYFREARLYINTSTVEGYPNTYMQAAMNATPIVSLDVDPDGLLSTASCGYCAFGRWDRFVAGVDRLVNDRAEWRRKSENAYRFAREHYMLETNVGELKHIIRNVLSGRKERGPVPGMPAGRSARRGTGRGGR